MPELTYREAISQGLREALQDRNVFIMGEDIGYYGGAYAVTKGFVQEFGEERIKDTPISESAIVGAGIGAALAGLRPIVEIMTINFSLMAMDQIVNHAAKLRYMSGGQLSVPLIVRTVTGGGAQLAATHSQSFEGWYAHVPGLKVLAPSTPNDALGLFRSALQEEDPVIFVEHILLYGSKGEVPEHNYTIPIGKAEFKIWPIAGTDNVSDGIPRVDQNAGSVWAWIAPVFCCIRSNVLHHDATTWSRTLDFGQFDAKFLSLASSQWRSTRPTFWGFLEHAWRPLLGRWGGGG